MSDKHFHYVGFEDATCVDMYLDGWSLPPFFYAFPDVVAILLLQKYNQTILADYILPLRYVAPPPTVGVARNMGTGTTFDPTHSSTGSYRDFSRQVSTFIKTLKADPSLIGISPYPIQFGYLGMDGRQFLTVDLLEHYENNLVQNMGIPPEFYRGGINAQVATPSNYGFTLYVRFWRPLVSAINRLNQWTTDRIAELQRWPALTAKMVPPTIFASPELMPVLLQRNAEGKLSDTTLDRMLNVSTEYEVKAVENEMTKREERATDLQRRGMGKDMVQQILADASPELQAMTQLQAAATAAMPGAPVPVGAPAGMAPAPAMAAASMNPASPEGSPAAGITAAEQGSMQQVSGKAQQIAMQMVQTYPDVTARGVALRELESAQPQFAMFVKQAIQEIEGQAKKQGLQMVRGGGGGRPV